MSPEADRWSRRFRATWNAEKAPARAPSSMGLQPGNTVVQHRRRVLMANPRVQIDPEERAGFAIDRRQRRLKSKRAIWWDMIVVRAALERHRGPVGVRTEIGHRVDPVVKVSSVRVRVTGRHQLPSHVHPGPPPIGGPDDAGDTA